MNCFLHSDRPFYGSFRFPLTKALGPTLSIPSHPAPRAPSICERSIQIYICAPFRVVCICTNVRLSYTRFAVIISDLCKKRFRERRNVLGHSIFALHLRGRCSIDIDPITQWFNSFVHNMCSLPGYSINQITYLWDKLR